jgi:hypothetical protein
LLVAQTEQILWGGLMARKSSPNPPRVGRPPAGARPGERVKDYPQVSLRVPREVKRELQLLGKIRAQPQWRIVCEALKCYLRTLPSYERKQLADLQGRPGVD